MKFAITGHAPTVLTGDDRVSIKLKRLEASLAKATTDERRAQLQAEISKLKGI
jgi:hypothetical protein